MHPIRLESGELQKWGRRTTEVEYSVDDSLKTIKKTGRAVIGTPGISPGGVIEKQVHGIATNEIWARRNRYNGLDQKSSLHQGTETLDACIKGTSIQGTTNIECHAGYEECSSFEKIPEQRIAEISDLRLGSKILERKNSYLHKPISNRFIQNTSSDTQEVSRVSWLKNPDLTVLRRTVSAEIRCPISLSLKRKSMLKLEPHRGDQDFPYLINQMGLLESQSSRTKISLKKATLVDLHQSWFSSNGVIRTSKTVGAQTVLSGSEEGMYRGKLSIDQYPICKLIKPPEKKSRGYKRLNLFSSRFYSKMKTSEP
jgi:hypothetical protein